MKLNYRLTPWDSKAFGFTTAEILVPLNLNITPLEFFNEISIIEKELYTKRVKFVYTRINAQNFNYRKQIQDLGYYFAETSFSVVNTKIQKWVKKKLPNLNLSPFKISDANILKGILKSSFDYSRFHEDTRISDKLSRIRYENWFDDLISDDSNIFSAKLGKEIIGLLIQKESDTTTDLILAGCKKGYEVFSPSLWNEIIAYNKDKGFKKIITTISASNIGVANIYMSQNFKIKHTMFGYHKFLN